MTKNEFISYLKEKLSGIPEREADERIAFFVEMIEDRMEDGLSESESVAMAGDIDGIAEQIISEVPMALIVKEKVKPKKKLRVWETVLIILGSPIWLSLFIAAFSVFFSLYAVLWSLVICCFAVFVTFVACSLGAVLAGGFIIAEGNVPSGLAMIGAGLVLCGLSIFMFYICRLAIKGTVYLTKKIALSIKKCFVTKEAK